MATIVQDYGPIYGEVVNGTVQGRPNGSIYVPITNTIAMRFALTPTHIKIVGTGGVLCQSGGSYHQVDVIAEAQDLASNVKTCVYSDSGCTTLVAARTWTAGKFNIDDIYAFVNGSFTLTTGNTYYARAELYNNGSLIASTAALAVEAL